MKTDIEKLRAEYEEKLQNAIESNRIIDILGEETLHIAILGNSCHDKTKKHLYIKPDDFNQELTIEQVGKILEKFPSTEKFYIDKNNAKELKFDYDACIKRRYNDKYSILDISYFSGDYDISLEIPIEPNKELNGFFADSTRRIDPIEIRAHYVVSRPNRRAADVMLPIKVFANGEYIKYQMGRIRSTSEYAVHNIVETIKECYLKSISHEEVCQ